MASAEALTPAGLNVMRTTTSENCPGGITAQVLSVVTLPGSQRMKLVVTDGTEQGEAALGSDHYHLFASGQLKEYSVVLVDKYMAQTVDGKNKYVLNHLTVTGNPGRSLGPETPAPPAKKARIEPGSAGGASQTPPASLGKGTQGSRRIQSLNALNPYMGSWTVRVKVASKGQLRIVKTKNGDKKVLSLDFTDEQDTSIQATAWGDVADKLSAMEEGKVYYVSNGQLRPANRQYSTTNNDYEMALNERSIVEEASDAADMQITVKFDFMGIDRLASRLGTKAPVDVLGIVTECSDLGTVNRKADGSQLTKREVTLVDASSRTVRVTLWGKTAETEGAAIQSMDNPVVAIKGLRISDYNGVSLQTLSRSVVAVEPDLPEARELKSWFANGGSSAPTTEAGAGLASGAGGKGGEGGGNGRRTLTDMQPADLAAPDAKPEWGTTLCTVLFVRSENPYYTACPTPKCNKKVTEDGGGQWRCEACSTSFPACQRRYMLSLKATDATGSCWISTFNDQAAQILGMSADDLHVLREQADGSFEKAIQKALWTPFVMKLKSKTEVYKEEANRRITAVGLQKPDYAAESKALLQLLKGAV